MQIKTDRERDGLFGAVRSVQQEIAYISEKAGKWVISPRQLQAVTTYDREGKRTSQSFHTHAYGQSLSEHGVTKHDVDRNIIQHSRYYEGVLQSKVFFTYDGRGRKIEEMAYSPEGVLYHRTIYKYDAQGRVVEMSTYDVGNTIISKHTYTNDYDSVGNLTKITVRRWTNTDGKLLYQPLCEIYYDIAYY